jgi:hypothetical protein
MRRHFICTEVSFERAQGFKVKRVAGHLKLPAG